MAKRSGGSTGWAAAVGGHSKRHAKRLIGHGRGNKTRTIVRGNKRGAGKR